MPHSPLKYIVLYGSTALALVFTGVIAPDLLVRHYTNPVPLHVTQVVTRGLASTDPYDSRLNVIETEQAKTKEAALLAAVAVSDMQAKVNAGYALLNGLFVLVLGRFIIDFAIYHLKRQN